MELNSQDNNHGFSQEDPVIRQSSAMSLIMLLLLIVLGGMIGLLMIHGIGTLKGIDTENLFGLINSENSSGNRDFVRNILLINHLTMFVIPGFLFAIIFYRGNWARFLNLHKIPMIRNIGIGILIMLVAIPFVQFSYWCNQQIPLPDWALTMEDSTNQMIERLLVVDAPYELIFNVLVIALIPALGEEIIFRGIIQRKFRISLSNPHLAIWITAFIFSAIHMQFEGFLPRMILGALLGYLFYWTNNLWIPIIAHFVNNASQIILQFLYAEKISSIDIENADQVPWFIGIISLIFVLVLANFMKNNNQIGIEEGTA